MSLSLVSFDEINDPFNGKKNTWGPGECTELQTILLNKYT